MLARAMQPRLSEQARLSSSSGRMWSATFSPDGKQIVTTDDKNAQLWDARTYRLLFTLPHDDTVYRAAYSADGKRLVTPSGDGTVKLWDPADGSLIRSLRRDGSKLRYAIAALSPDGKVVAAIDAMGEITHVWDTATGAPVAELRNAPLEFPGLAFSADGRWLATTGGDDVRVFDARTWALASTIEGPHIHRLAFDPTGPRLLTGASTGDVAIWDIPSGTRIRHLHDVGEPANAVAFSPDGQLVVAGSRDGLQQIWRTTSGALQSQVNARHSKILAVEFDRASRLVLATYADGTVVIADALLGMPVTTLEGPQNVLRAHFDPSSQYVIGASLDGGARVWSATPPYMRWSSPSVAEDCGIATTPEPDSRFVAVGCRDQTTRVWDTARDQLLAELPSVSRVNGDFTSAFPAVSATGALAAIARGDEVAVYELPGGRLVRTIAHRAPVSAVAFAKTGRDMVSGAIDGSLIVARDNGALLILPPAGGGIDTVGFLSDGRVLAADAKEHLRVHDPVGALLADLELPARVMSLRSEGTQVIAIPIYTGKPASPILLDLARNALIGQLQGHVGRVFAARWVAGHRILTAGGDGTARMWDGTTGELRQVYRGNPRFLADAVLEGDLVVAGGADGHLRFWDAASGRLLWAIAAHKSALIGIHVEGGDFVTRGFSGELTRWRFPDPQPVIAACSAHERCVIVQR
jgi:WD40 repeat protein